MPPRKKAQKPSNKQHYSAPVPQKLLDFLFVCLFECVLFSMTLASSVAGKKVATFVRKNQLFILFLAFGRQKFIDTISMFYIYNIGIIFAPGTRENSGTSDI